MNNIITYIGIALIIIGFIAIIIGSLLQERGKTRVEWGFGGFIGPFPFGFASSKPLLYLIIIIAFVLFILFLVIQRVV